MCGIAGTYGFTDRLLVREMCKTIEHRGPDDRGYFEDERVSLGCQRLSIIDVEGGHQPISNEDGDVWVVYNGEIYNFPELRVTLESGGHDFSTRSDTEVLVHLYEELGESFVAELAGMFAFALYDSSKDRLVLARDRAGIKPLYYSLQDDGIVFSSELKSVLRYDLVSRELNLRAVDHYFARRFTPTSETIFQDVTKIPPGHMMVISDEERSLEPYWRLDAQTGFWPEKSQVKMLGRALKDSVEIHLLSDVPLGLFLSGGLDSSILAALMSKMIEARVDTFTAGFGEETDEFRFARTVAEHLGTVHHEVMVDYGQMTKLFPEIVWYMDEPVADPALLPTYFAAKLARRFVKVALLGEGADELFAGYEHYRVCSPYLSLVPAFVKVYLYNVFHGRQGLGYAERKRIYGGIMQADSSLSSWNVNSVGGELLRGLLFNEFRNILPNFQLARVDRMSMANSLEARVPYLDRSMVDLAFSMPSRLKLKGFTGKYVLRQTAKDLLPKIDRSIIEGGKRIFLTPLDRWMTNGFYEVAESLLDSSRELGLFDKAGIAKLLNGFRGRKGSFKLWILAQFFAWYRIFVEGRADKKRFSIEKLT